MKKKSNNKQSKEEVLKEVQVFVELYKDDPIVISACLMIVAKDIYVNIFGPKHASELLNSFANSRKNTIH